VGRGIALLFHDRGTRRGWVVSSTPQPHLTPRKDPVPLFPGGRVGPRAGLEGRKISSPTGIRSWTVKLLVSRYTDWATRPIYIYIYIQCVPLATETGISLIILTPMKILQRSLNRSTFVVWEMKRNVSVVRFKFRCNILIRSKIVKEMPGSVASGTPVYIST